MDSAADVNRDRNMSIRYRFFNRLDRGTGSLVRIFLEVIKLIVEPKRTSLKIAYLFRRACLLIVFV